MSELPSEPERCPYTWEKCWLMTIKGEGICKGCKHGEYAVVEKGTIKKLDAKVRSDAIIPEKVIIRGKNSDSRCQITGKPCEMIATAGFRWCEGCRMYNEIMGTEVKISNEQVNNIQEEEIEQTNIMEKPRFEKNNSKRESRKSRKARIAEIEQQDNGKTSKTMENDTQKPTEPKVPMGHKKVGFWEKIRNLFR